MLPRPGLSTLPAPLLPVHSHGWGPGLPEMVPSLLQGAAPGRASSLGAHCPSCLLSCSELRECSVRAVALQAPRGAGARPRGARGCSRCSPGGMSRGRQGRPVRHAPSSIWDPDTLGPTPPSSGPGQVGDRRAPQDSFLLRLRGAPRGIRAPGRSHQPRNKTARLLVRPPTSTSRDDKAPR